MLEAVKELVIQAAIQRVEAAALAVAVMVASPEPRSNVYIMY